MPICQESGNIFTTSCETIVNPVNCVGVMGAGLAFEFKLRYPEMYIKYKEKCEKNEISIGNLWLYRSKDRSVLNFPTKNHWRHPSKIEYLERGFEAFVLMIEEHELKSVAFPLLGADKGGLGAEVSLKVMENFLRDVDVDIEIWHYSPRAADDLFDRTKNVILNPEYNLENLAKDYGIQKSRMDIVVEAMESDYVSQLGQLAQVRGVGQKTVEKLFAMVQSDAIQRDLFK